LLEWDAGSIQQNDRASPRGRDPWLIRAIGRGAQAPAEADPLCAARCGFGNDSEQSSHHIGPAIHAQRNPPLRSVLRLNLAGQFGL